MVKALRWMGCDRLQRFLHFQHHLQLCGMLETEKEIYKNDSELRRNIMFICDYCVKLITFEALPLRGPSELTQHPRNQI